MVLNLKDLFEKTGDSLSFEYDLDLAGVKYAGGHTLNESAHIKGTVENSTGIVTLGYLATFTLNTLCDCCLEETVIPFALSSKHIVVSELSGEDDDSFVLCEDYKLDLDELAASDIILELPTKILCRENCKGLCPTCGIHLNESTCNCNTKQVDPRLEILLTLLDKED